jgi:hypothetical protein
MVVVQVVVVQIVVVLTQVDLDNNLLNLANQVHMDSETLVELQVLLVLMDKVLLVVVVALVPQVLVVEVDKVVLQTEVMVELVKLIQSQMVQLQFTTLVVVEEDQVRHLVELQKVLEDKVVEHQVLLLLLQHLQVKLKTLPQIKAVDLVELTLVMVQVLVVKV